MSKRRTAVPNLQLIGASAVGKSCIYNRSTNSSWKFSYEIPVTIGATKPTLKSFTFEDGETFDVNVWDCGGQERFEIISKAFLKKAEGCIIVYSADDENSFDCAKNWIQAVCEIKSEKESSMHHLQVVLVANKVDLEDTDGVTFDHWRQSGQDLAKEYGVAFFETSAKSNKGISVMFDHVARLMKESRRITKKQRRYSSRSVSGSEAGTLECCKIL
eukprot:g139.t1